MILGLALYPISDAFLKHLMGIYSVEQTTFLRSFTRMIPLLAATFLQGGPVKVLMTNHPKRHLARLSVNLLYTYAFMSAFSLGSLTMIYTLSYTSAFFMIFLGAVLLKEKVSWNRWLSVFVGLLGVLIAMRPGANVFEWAALLVLAATFLGALNKILMRKLSKTEKGLTIALYPNIAMVFLLFPYVLYAWKSMPLEHWVLFAFVGILTAAGQYAIAQALSFAEASLLAPIDYSTLFWVISLDFLCWQALPSVSTGIGAFLIVGSNLYIVYRAKKEKESSVGAQPV